MKELLVVLLVFVVWFLLQAYILPKCGVKTLTGSKPPGGERKK